jgi:hypothetical protein
LNGPPAQKPRIIAQMARHPSDRGRIDEPSGEPRCGLVHAAILCMQTAKHHFEASIDFSFDDRRHAPLAVLGAFPLAALVAFVSLVGISSASIYARETPNWAAQAVGQDWFDLLFAVPWLLVTGVFAMRGSRRAQLLLAGGMLYTFYEFVIYCFSVHFNALFLAYCATLGGSFFALVGMGKLLFSDSVRWHPNDGPIRTAGVFLIGVGCLFALAWLGDIVTALMLHSTPPSVQEAGVPTNPVHVIDLSIVLPLHVIAGVALLRRRPVGYVLAPVVLAFGVLMALSLAGMMFVMRARGFEASLVLVSAMIFIATASAAILAFLLRRVDAPRGAR